MRALLLLLLPITAAAQVPAGFTRCITTSDTTAFVTFYINGYLLPDTQVVNVVVAHEQVHVSQYLAARTCAVTPLELARREVVAYCAVNVGFLQRRFGWSRPAARDSTFKVLRSGTDSTVVSTPHLKVLWAEGCPP